MAEETHSNDSSVEQAQTDTKQPAQEAITESVAEISSDVQDRAVDAAESVRNRASDAAESVRETDADELQERATETVESFRKVATDLVTEPTVRDELKLTIGAFSLAGIGMGLASYTVVNSFTGSGTGIANDTLGTIVRISVFTGIALVGPALATIFGLRTSRVLDEDDRLVSVTAGVGAYLGQILAFLLSTLVLLGTLGGVGAVGGLGSLFVLFLVASIGAAITGVASASLSNAAADA